MSRSRSWCFTINNDVYSDLRSLMDIPVRYMIFGFESGEQGTPHIQGYMYFWDAKSLTAVKKYNKRMHLEKSKGSPQENYEYCTKDGDWYEFGEIPQQGSATLDKIRDVMEDPYSNIHLYQQYKRVMRELEYCKKKDHERVVFYCLDERQFAIADSTERSKAFITSYDEYDDEDVVFIPCYNDRKYIDQWYHGYPPKFRRGYEMLVFDPAIIVCTYSGEDQLGFLKKNYPGIVDIDAQDCQEEEDSSEESDEEDASSTDETCSEDS